MHHSQNKIKTFKHAKSECPFFPWLQVSASSAFVLPLHRMSHKISRSGAHRPTRRVFQAIDARILYAASLAIHLKPLFVLFLLRRLPVYTAQGNCGSAAIIIIIISFSFRASFCATANRYTTQPLHSIKLVTRSLATPSICLSVCLSCLCGLRSLARGSPLERMPAAV